MCGGIRIPEEGPLRLESSFGARAHRKTDLILGGVGFRQYHQSQIAPPKRRQGKFNPYASLVIALACVASIYGSTLDGGFDLRPYLGLPIGAPQNLHVELDVAGRQPRLRIQQLHLNSARAIGFFGRRGHLGGERAGTQLFYYQAMLFFDSFSQPVRTEFGRSCKLLVTG
jgi:hypothetical protein